MSSELILITGPTLSGKTRLAKMLRKQFNNAAKIWDEPITDRKFFKEIRLFTAYHGRAIITCIEPPIGLEQKLSISWRIKLEIP